MEAPKFYLATNKKTNAHMVLGEEYIEAYEELFVKIREFDTVEEAKEALAIREETSRPEKGSQPKDKIRVSKIRGDIRRGDASDELSEDAMRIRLRAEILEELKGETIPLSPPTPPKKTTRPTKQKLE